MNRLKQAGKNILSIPVYFATGIILAVMVSVGLVIATFDFITGGREAILDD